MRALLTCLILVVMVAIDLVPVYSQPNRKTVPKKLSQFEEIDFEGLIRRYLEKDAGQRSEIEGIYSVSAVIVKRSKGLFSTLEKDKVVKRSDNYAKVAILRDRDSKREFIEVSLNAGVVAKYPIIGDFSGLSEGRGYIYKHYEPKKETVAYTFTTDKDGDILEGERAIVVGRKTVITKLSYLKIHPKKEKLISDL